MMLVALFLSGLLDHINDTNFAEQIVPHMVYPLIGIVVLCTLLNVEEIKVVCKKKAYVFMVTVVGNSMFGFLISGIAPMKWYNGGACVCKCVYICINVFITFNSHTTTCHIILTFRCFILNFIDWLLASRIF